MKKPNDYPWLPLVTMIADALPDEMAKVCTPEGAMRHSGNYIRAFYQIPDDVEFPAFIRGKSRKVWRQFGNALVDADRIASFITGSIRNIPVHGVELRSLTMSPQFFDPLTSAAQAAVSDDARPQVSPDQLVDSMEDPQQAAVFARSYAMGALRMAQNNYLTTETIDAELTDVSRVEPHWSRVRADNPAVFRIGLAARLVEVAMQSAIHKVVLTAMGRPAADAAGWVDEYIPARAKWQAAKYPPTDGVAVH